MAGPHTSKAANEIVASNSKRDMDKFELLLEEHRSMQLAKHHFHQLTKRLAGEEKRLQLLYVILEKEYGDLKRFEQLSLKGLFNRFLKSDQEQYEIEKQEYLFAMLQYREAENLVELLSYEKKILEKKLLREKEVQVRLNREIDEKEHAITEKYKISGSRLVQINRDIRETLGFKTELKEARIVCARIDKLFAQMLVLLRQAKKYENWGEFYSEKQEGKRIRKSYIDQAHSLSYVAKQQLQQLEDDLESIYKHKSIYRLTKYEEFQHLNEIYYDRLISDWIVKHRIDSTIQCIAGTGDSIQRIAATLDSQIEKVEVEIRLLYVKRDDYIVHLLDS